MSLARCPHCIGGNLISSYEHSYKTPVLVCLQCGRQPRPAPEPLPLAVVERPSRADVSLRPRGRVPGQVSLVGRIREMARAGARPSVIADELECTRAYVSHVLHDAGQDAG